MTQQAQQPQAIQPNEVYALTGIQIMTILDITQSMPRAIDAQCRQIENLVLSAQRVTIQKPTSTPDNSV